MTVGSLFAGIGGFDLGLERAGFEIRWQVEIDPFCQKVLAKHWPDVKRYTDVRYCGSRAWADGIMDDMEAGGCGDAPSCPVSYHGLEPVDVICGGFPCQDISVAGRGDGITGERSGLWREYDRLIGELRPRVVVVENVSALLVRGLGTVLRDLAARGFDAEWDCLPASAFGAPHQRDRVWIVAHTNDRGPQERRPESVAGIPECGGREQARSSVGAAATESGVSAEVADTDSTGQREQWRAFPTRTELASTECRRWWGTEPDVGRVAHGIPARVDRLRGLGNAILPQIAEWIGRRILDAERAG